MSELYLQFQKLRDQVNKDCEIQSIKRIKNNPKPTDLELRIGTHKEMLEYQVRDALLVMNKKGYITDSSGFYGEHGQLQVIEGSFSIDKDTADKLKKFGVKLRDKYDLKMPGLPDTYTRIEFKPKNADIEEIKSTWDQIAASFPQKNNKQKSPHDGSLDFLYVFAPERTDIEKNLLEKRIKSKDYYPINITYYQYRLKQLQNEKR